MELLGNFYTLEEFDYANGTLTAEVLLNPNHPIYEGHFPEQSVVPGVCTLTIIRESLSRAMGCKVKFQTIKECKYVAALLPQENLRIRLNFTVSDSLQVKGTVARCDDQQVVLKLNAQLQ